MNTIWYRYSGATGEHTGYFNADVVDGEEVTDYLNATKIEPNVQKGFASVFDKVTKTWSYVENHVGEEGYVNREWLKIKELGTLPEGFTHDLPEREKTLEEKQAEIRSERDRLLTACDFTQMADSPLSETQKGVWKLYRQSLRDITIDPLFDTEPENIVFPVTNEKV